MKRLDDLKKLGELLQSGVLTQEEFEQQKALILAEDEAEAEVVLSMPEPPTPDEYSGASESTEELSSMEARPDAFVHEESAEDLAGWTKVANGLHYMYVGVAVACVAAMLGAGLVSLSEGFAPLVVLIVLGGAIAIVVGQIMLAWIPEVTGARTQGLILAICALGSIVIGLLGGVQVREQQNNGLDGISSLLNLVVVVVFPIFVKKVAGYLGSEQLRKTAVRYLWFLGGSFLMLFVIGASLSEKKEAPASLDEGTEVFLGIVILGFVIVWLIWYMRLIRGLRDAIRATKV